MKIFCILCDRPIDDKRRERGESICHNCEFPKDKTPRVKGHMVFGHKTAPTIEIHDPASWERNSKYYNGTKNGRRAISRM
jgi:hypothetical protein